MVASGHEGCVDTDFNTGWPASSDVGRMGRRSRRSLVETKDCRSEAISFKCQSGKAFPRPPLGVSGLGFDLDTSQQESSLFGWGPEPEGPHWTDRGSSRHKKTKALCLEQSCVTLPLVFAAATSKIVSMTPFFLTARSFCPHTSF